MASNGETPYNRKEMLRAGYKLLSGSTCKGCGAAIEWWQSTHGSKLPFDLAAGELDQAVTHWKTCPKADEFSGSKRSAPQVSAPAPAAQRPPVEQYRNITGDLGHLFDKYNARAVVLIDDKGTHARWRKDLPGEELRSDMISAGNFIRTEIAKGDKTL